MIDVANEQNLIPQAHKLTVEEQSKGGIASGETRRSKKTRRELALQIANAQVTNNKIKKMVKNVTGLPDEEITGDAAVLNGLYSAAISGDMKAYDRWEQLTADDKVDDTEYELPARVIGESFVRINRHIQPNKTYIFEGGRGSTKSSFVSLKIVELLKNNPNMHACVVRKVGGTLRDSVYAQLLWAINELKLNDEFEATVSPLEITYKKTKQKIYFRGCDDPIKLKGIKPVFGYVGILWKEEKDQLAGPEEERSVNQSVLRGGNIAYDFSSYNPPKTKANWVNKEKEIPDANRIIHHSTYQTVDEEWLGQKFIDDAEHLKEVNPVAYEHEYLGIPNGSGGNVFDNVVIREITDKEIEDFDHVMNGVDWGWYPDLYAFVRVHYDPAQLRLYIWQEYTCNKQSNRQTANVLFELGITGDDLITCDSAESKSIGDYRSYGLLARPAEKGPGSREYSFKWLQSLREIVIDNIRCPVAAEEFLNYEYERDKDGNVISGYPDGDDHVIDAVRYATNTQWKRRGE